MVEERRGKEGEVEEETRGEERKEGGGEEGRAVTRSFRAAWAVG